MAAKAKKLFDTSSDANKLKTLRDIVVPPQQITGEFVPIHIPQIDRVLGGGVLTGKMLEIYGDMHSGKTTLGLKVVKAFLDYFPSKAVIWIDIEHAFSPKWASINGVDQNDERFIIKQTDDIELTLMEVSRAVETLPGTISLVVIDSVAAMKPKENWLDAKPSENPYDSNAIGSHARFLAQVLPRFVPLCSNQNVTILALNQARTNMGRGMAYTDSTGGRAMKHYVSYKLELRPSMIFKHDEAYDASIREGIRVKVFCNKNRFGQPYMQEEFVINPSHGLSYVDNVVEFAIAHGIVETRGSWFNYTYSVKDRDGNAVEKQCKAQGSKAFLEVIRTTVEAYRHLLDHVYDSLMFDLENAYDFDYEPHLDGGDGNEQKAEADGKEQIEISEVVS